MLHSIIQNTTNKVVFWGIPLENGTYDFDLTFDDSTCTNTATTTTSFSISGVVCNCTAKLDVTHLCDDNDSFNFDIGVYDFILYQNSLEMYKGKIHIQLNK